MLVLTPETKTVWSRCVTKTKNKINLLIFVKTLGGVNTVRYILLELGTERHCF